MVDILNLFTLIFELLVTERKPIVPQSQTLSLCVKVNRFVKVSLTCNNDW